MGSATGCTQLNSSRAYCCLRDWDLGAVHLPTRLRGFTAASATVQPSGVSWDQSRSTTLRSELLTFNSPLYSMKPSLRNLFMKKLTRERVVPTISANISCDTLGNAR